MLGSNLAVDSHLRSRVDSNPMNLLSRSRTGSPRVMATLGPRVDRTEHVKLGKYSQPIW
eukprot:c43651_g1_i1 orf=23-199(-)